MMSSRVVRTVLPLIIVTSAFLNAIAQTSEARDEEFDLNITQEHIVETDFVRSLTASLRNDKLSLEAGASVSAAQADITIRNATGHIRFRTVIDSLNRLLRGR